MTNIPSDYNQTPPAYGGATYPEAGTAATSPAAWPPVESPSTAEVAKGEAAAVRDSAVDAGRGVAATAKDEAVSVAGEARQQARSLWGSVSSEVRDQAGAQQQKIAAGVQSLAQELGGMASGSAESGPLTDLARQAAEKGGEVARWLESREPRDVLREVQDFGRRRPVMFLALCGLAGVVAGRLTRGAVAANTSIDSPSSATSENGRRGLAGGSGYGSGYEPARSASLVEELPTTYEGTAYESSRAADLGYAGTPAPGYGVVDPAVDPGNPSGGLR